MSELEYWLGLARLLNTYTFTSHVYKLLNKLQQKMPIQSLFQNKELEPKLSQVLFGKHLKLNRTGIAKDIEWLQNPTRKILTLQDKLYPKLLKQIHFPPLVLFIQSGYTMTEQRLYSCLTKKSIAMVGSRQVEAKVLLQAETFAQALAANNFCITSGLALGVDAAAHKGALNAKAATIAVLPLGLDNIYPKRHRRLAEDILFKEGLLVSEQAIGAEFKKDVFTRRNRIITGLSQALLVVQAALKSGSMLSAKYAMEQDRDIFALPGRSDDIAYRGCNRLIKQGACLVEDPNDLLLCLGS